MQCGKTVGGFGTPEYQETPIDLLDQLLSQILTDADDAPVLITMDAPICMPNEFSRPGSKLGGAFWPFNLNPFSTRPCEKSLSSTPSGVLSQNLLFPEIAKIVGLMAGWEGDYRDQANLPMTKIHIGLSVLGYQGAPHGPVVSLFRDKLTHKASEKGIGVSYSPSAASKPELGWIYILESHPAVTMAVWIYQQRLGTLRQLPRYKGDSSQITKIGFAEVSSSVIKLFNHEVAELQSSVTTDDELDALVGLANCVDLVRGDADWWGTEDSGYFLIPRIRDVKSELSVREAWDTANRYVIEYGGPS